MKTFKLFFEEQKTVDAKVQEFFTNNPNLNDYDDEELVSKLIKLGATRKSAIAKLNKRFNNRFALKEDTERQLQKEVVAELNRKLALVLQKSNKFRNQDFNKFVDNLSKEVDPIFNEEGLDVVKDSYVIYRSGLKDSGENNMKIAADNIEFENVVLNIKWSKDDNGFLLINLEVKII